MEYDADFALRPATGMDEEKQYVKATLVFRLPRDYPDTAPSMAIRDARGLGDEDAVAMRQAMDAVAKESLGGPMLYAMMEVQLLSLEETRA